MATISLGVARGAEGAACRVGLRSLRGADELAVDGVDTRAAVRLLDGLVERASDSAPAVADLCASDRDRLLAAVHRDVYGDTIQASPLCTACGAIYDLSFSLSGLQRHIEAQRTSGPSGPHPPSASAEIAAGECEWDDGLALLRAAGGNAAAEVLEAAAPLLDLELDATCPECGAVQAVGFDIQSFLLRILLNDRPALVQDVHLLASTYHWPLASILELTRADRRALVAAVDDDRGRSLQALRNGWR
jgi:hypothetical protein